MTVEPLPTPEIIEEGQTLWNTEDQPAGCDHCHRVFLAAPKYRGANCPICRQGTLDAQPAYIRRAEPEKMLPFKIPRQNLFETYKSFVSGVWIKPEEFNPETLLKNTRALFWPLWLVDSDVSGHWGMQAGFDYQVESAKEVFEGGRWQSHKQIENRVRWEPRVGQISTRIDNVITPALQEHENRLAMTGAYPLERAIDYDPTLLGSAFLELPDNPHEAAWSQARPDFDKTLAKICQQAAGAQHFRDFTMRARFSNQNWTAFLLPMYTTHYRDDEGQPQVLVVNAHSGAIRGPRLASSKRGDQIAGIIGAVAGGLFLLALLGLLLATVFPVGTLIAGLLGVLGLIAGILAIVTAIWPRQWNRKQSGPRITHQEEPQP